ncbi:MAG TPA: Crp/Fnr family transcriptional regulator [Pyrinomonadaceae bacterium]|nr:Crp/Fnr family transcriptional regulator [Pyrinomonadaceae bacterium]
MLSLKGPELEVNLNGFAAQIPCDSAISEVRGLDSLKVSKLYPRGSVLFSEGQRPRGVYLLSNGRAKISITSADGKTLVLRIAEPGELLGIKAALTGQPYEATVETLGRCRIDFISREALLKLLARDRKACLGVARALAGKLSGAFEHARLVLLPQSAQEKLARLLIGWCEKSGKRTPHGTRIESGLTHEEIAQMICVSRETVTRALSELKRKHIVSWLGNTFYVRNRKALESVARC